VILTLETLTPVCPSFSDVDTPYDPITMGAPGELSAAGNQELQPNIALGMNAGSDSRANPLTDDEPAAQYYTYNALVAPQTAAQPSAAPELGMDVIHNRLMQLGADTDSRQPATAAAASLDQASASRRMAPPPPPHVEKHPLSHHHHHHHSSGEVELGVDATHSEPTTRTSSPSEMGNYDEGEPAHQVVWPGNADAGASSATPVASSAHVSETTTTAPVLAVGNEPGDSKSELPNVSGQQPTALAPSQTPYPHIPPGLRLTPSGHLEDSSGNVYFDMSDRVAFAMRPAPKRAMIQCSIVREKSLFKSVFHCYLHADGAFLINAKKMKGSKTPHFEISVRQDDFEKTSPGYLGKLRGNFLGTEFTIYDAGYNPEKHPDWVREYEESKANTTESVDALLPMPQPQKEVAAEGAIGTVKGGARSQPRRELGTVVYESNFLAPKSPRKMHVLLPRIYRNNVAAVWRPLKPTDSLLANYRATCTDAMYILENKTPRWNERLRAYVLNFGGRVTLPSVKNFQLVQAEDPETVVLQFGRTAKDTFTMDYSYPLTLVQAFGICLTSLESKLACD